MTRLRSLDRFSTAFGALTFLSVLPCAAMAGSVTIEPGVEPFDAAQDEEAVGFRNGSFIAVPIPTSDPTLGAGLTVVAGYLFTLDAGSKPSGVGLATLRTDNGSEAFGLAANFSFDNNRWQIESLFAQANINYDLFTPIGEVPVRQDGRIMRAELTYGFTQDLAVGFAVRYLDTSISPDGLGVQIPPPFDRFLNMDIISPALVAKYDRRDDTIYPTRGFHLKAQASHSYTLEGITGDYSKAFLNYTHYFSPSLNGVVAARASTCAASDETPFFDQCSLGATDAFRGFPVTQFLNLRSASLQVEYRHRFTKRLGAVAFAGAGQTGDSFSTLSSDGTQFAAGLGIRYRVSKKFPLDLSVDWARNDDSQDQLYIYVGQRF
ncbi:BamA/TamA family outer membrane protein [Ruegeria marisrubri]|uniref:BamA/TamA family outer membrane protein n=1 Tax=Ruegeria marisrubri TaxID=1685379 RepID=UPI001CD5F9A6|nr:BamA/TamA family outer membrane protein [Ruegeria marisrubri]MCA0905706.1 BamA/TamA family outer membrane protein [Ruegeria marisrubri]